MTSDASRPACRAIAGLWPMGRQFALH